jgi:ABC-2 type transport system ATP-binding protein
MKKEGKGIVLSTHMLNLAEKLCDRVLLINAGRAVLQGYVKDLKSEDEVEVEYVENGELRVETTDKSLKELVEMGLDVRKYLRREITLEEIFLREVTK